MIPQLILALALIVGTTSARADDGPPARDDFEADADGDGVPDGWYNLRDCEWIAGGIGKGHCLRFQAEKPGRPARASRAFGVDGKTIEALVVGVHVRADGVRSGERLSDESGLMVDFLGDELKAVGRLWLGPWTSRSLGDGWIYLAKRVDVPLGTHDAILTLGLLGATGTLDVDGLTIEAIPRGGVPSTNLLVNGDAEVGDPAPAGWVLEGGAHRIAPGHRSSACIELSRAGSRASIALAGPIGAAQSLRVELAARASGLRGQATGTAFFVDRDGEPLPAFRGGMRTFRFSGSFDWQPERTVLAVPDDASGIVLQFDKSDGAGTLRIDDLSVTGSPDAETVRWTPGHVASDSDGWKPYVPAEAIVPGSALDFSFLLPRGGRDLAPVRIQDGRLAADGQRTRFLGAVLLPTLAVPDPERADSLADHLARSGINLVRIGELDAPYGPARSLIDDARDDTKALEPEALARFDHLIAALKGRGIRVALELQSLRRFREGDEVPEHRDLTAGGGPAAAFDPTIQARAIGFARSLLEHVNTETGLALRDDPVLAWVTLAGEISLFDQGDTPMPAGHAEALKARLRQEKSNGKRGWQAIESAQWSAEAQTLRDAGLKAPIAGSSHWRREPEFSAAQTAPGLDLIDDRLYWSPPVWGDPARRSLLFDRRGLIAEAGKKRKADRPYVVGQYAGHTRGGWALPFEGADLLLTAAQARFEDWDALVRRGLFSHPVVWGTAAPGTTGEADILRIPEALNANPQIFALLPHAASLLIRPSAEGKSATKPAGSRPEGKNGVLALATPWTQVVAGWPGRKPYELHDMIIQADRDYAVIVASSVGPQPIGETDRVLVTAIGRVQPTGLTWLDERREAMADPGRSPLLVEPVRGQITWKRAGRGKARAYALDNAGNRAAEASIEAAGGGHTLRFDGKDGTLHWELEWIAEDGTKPQGQ